MADITTRLQEIAQRGGLRRTAKVGAVNTEKRTAEISFSSEAAEVPRWFGLEKLSHDPGAVDMGRMQDGAAVLWNHNPNDQRGVVEGETARIDPDRVGRATVRFSKSPDGERLMQDVADGIVSKVSVGYRVHGMKLSEERPNGDDVYTVTKWEPFEVSFTSIPADNGVGVGRNMQPETPREEQPAQSGEIPSAPTNKPSEVRTSMTEKTLRDAAGNLVRAKVDENGAITEVLEIVEAAGAAARSAEQRGLESERARVKSLTDLGNAYEARDLALEFIANGKTADDMQRELLGRFAEKRNASKPMSEQLREHEIGLTQREAQSFSIMRAVRALANPSNRAFQDAAKFEFECSRAAAEKAGKESRGIMIPADVLNRAFSTTTPTGGEGANAIAQNLLADQFIELLRNKTWALKRVTSMGGLVGNVDIPRQNSATQAYWVGEGDSPTGSQPGIDQIAMSPKTLGAYTDITRRLMMQSTPSAELIVRNDLLRVMALAVDYSVLYGTGSSGQPLGVLNQTGIHAVQLAGTYPTYLEYVQMETDIAAANAEVPGMSYVLNARAKGNAKSNLKFPAGVAGTTVAQGGTIWEPGDTVNGYSVDVTNQIADGDIFFGNWADCIVAMWSGLDLMVDPYSLSTSGSTRIVVFQDIDINVRHVASFTYANKNATPVA